MYIFLLAIGSIALSVTAQFALKAGMTKPEIQAALAHPLSLSTVQVVASNWFLIGGFFLYGLGAMVWLGVLARWDVSKAYPLVGLGIGATVALGIFLGEQVTVWRAVGVGLICIGVGLVSRS